MRDSRLRHRMYLGCWGRREVPASILGRGQRKFPTAVENSRARAKEAHGVIPPLHDRETIGDFAIAPAKLDGDRTIRAFRRSVAIHRIDAELVRFHITLTVVDGDNPDQERQAWIAQMVDKLRAYSQAGGDILFGTDIGYTDHYDTTLEFTLMSQAGMNYQQILASLTTNPARKFGDSDRVGRVATGMNADLVVLSADPAQDVTAFSKVHYTIRNGKVIYQER